MSEADTRVYIVIAACHPKTLVSTSAISCDMGTFA